MRGQNEERLSDVQTVLRHERRCVGKVGRRVCHRIHLHHQTVLVFPNLTSAEDPLHILYNHSIAGLTMDGSLVLWGMRQLLCSPL